MKKRFNITPTADLGRPNSRELRRKMTRVNDLGKVSVVRDCTQGGRDCPKLFAQVSQPIIQTKACIISSSSAHNTITNFWKTGPYIPFFQFE